MNSKFQGPSGSGSFSWWELESGPFHHQGVKQIWILIKMSPFLNKNYSCIRFPIKVKKGFRLGFPSKYTFKKSFLFPPIQNWIKILIDYKKKITFWSSPTSSYPQKHWWPASTPATDGQHYYYCISMKSCPYSFSEYHMEIRIGNWSLSMMYVNIYFLNVK